jgi:hypothetical protein
LRRPNNISSKTVERTACSWKAKEQMARANLMESERVKMGLTLVTDDLFVLLALTALARFVRL